MSYGLICRPQLKQFAVGPISSKWQGWSVARSGLHGNPGSDLLGAGRPPMAMNCTTHTERAHQPPIGATQTNMHTQKTHTGSYVGRLEFEQGHGQSQAAQMTSDPEKRPLPKCAVCHCPQTGLASGFTHTHTSVNTLSRSPLITYM